MYRLFFLVLCVVSTFSFNLAATPNCSQDHCAKISVRMNKTCMENNMHGKMYVVFGPDGNECECKCSCMLESTLVRQHDGTLTVIGALQVGNNLASPYSDIFDNFVGQLLHSEYQLSEAPGTVHHVKFSNGAEIVVSPEHTFVAPHEKVLAADELREGQSIMAENGQVVRVVSNTEATDFRGKLMNLIINPNSSAAKHHFLITNSVISGDWLVQSNHASFKADIDIRLGNINLFTE